MLQEMTSGHTCQSAAQDFKGQASKGWGTPPCAFPLCVCVCVCVCVHAHVCVCVCVHQAASIVSDSVTLWTVVFPLSGMPLSSDATVPRKTEAWCS